MSKLSFDALKERSEAVASVDLLLSISGGVENACHDSAPADPSRNPYQPSGNPLVDTVRGILWWTGLIN